MTKVIFDVEFFDTILNKIVQKYSAVFNGLGKLPGLHRMVVS
jgi:hypothetical protein